MSKRNGRPSREEAPSMTARWLATPKPVADVKPNPSMKFTCWCGWESSRPLDSSHVHLKEES